jgi:hypothetical protein
VEIAAEIEHGQPLFITGGVARIPPEAIDEHEIVYRVRSAPELDPGDLLIVEPRNTASTGELEVCFRGPRVYVGRWWAKHGLRELHPTVLAAIKGDLSIVGAVTLIVRSS